MTPAPPVRSIPLIPRARRNDPETSWAAADSVRDISVSQAHILAIFHQRGPLADGDLLDLYQQMVDAGDYPPLSVSGIRTRRSELVIQGLLCDTGDKALTVAGRATILWGVAA